MSWITTTFLMLSGALLFSCTSPAQRAEEAEQKVLDANEALDRANAEYLADVESYRLQTSTKIAENELIIKNLKEKIKTEKKSVRLDYENRIALLERKNNDMRTAMDNYKADGKDKWLAFKKEFDQDLNELGEALKNMVTNNVN